MQLLSFDEAIRHRAAPPGNPLLTAALEILWRAHRYAADAGIDVWQFAVEIDELRRSRVSNSELRWLLSQGYATHAKETASEGKRSFGRPSFALLGDASCFTLTQAGVALVESLEIVGPWTKSAPQTSSQITSESDGFATRALTVDARPSWDAQRRELWVDGRLVKRLRQQSPNQQAILDVFEAANWPSRISDPLPLRAAQCPKRRVHDAIKCLNRYHRHQAIRFGGDGSGRGILWEHFG